AQAQQALSAGQTPDAQKAYDTALQSARSEIVPVLMKAAERVPRKYLKNIEPEDLVGQQYQKDSFNDNLVGLGNEILSGNPINLRQWFTKAFINNAKDMFRKGGKERAIGTSDDDEGGGDVISNAAAPSEEPSEEPAETERQQDVASGQRHEFLQGLGV